MKKQKEHNCFVQFMTRQHNRQSTKFKWKQHVQIIWLNDINKHMNLALNRTKRNSTIIDKKNIVPTRRNEMPHKPLNSNDTFHTPYFSLYLYFPITSHYISLMSLLFLSSPLSPGLYLLGVHQSLLERNWWIKNTFLQLGWLCVTISNSPN